MLMLTLSIIQQEVQSKRIMSLCFDLSAVFLKREKKRGKGRFIHCTSIKLAA